ncbi:hypothetical protein K2Z84_30115 [Candidatus Binatia bacterium]|nr:hypothetical protein [Candidatus Binatia bacterium]
MVELVAGRPVVGAPVIALGSTRGAALAGFTTRLIDGPSDLDHADLDRLRRTGFSADEVRAAAETAIAFHVVAALAHAAAPRDVPAGVASRGNLAALMEDARGGDPVRAA